MIFYQNKKYITSENRFIFLVYDGEILGSAIDKREKELSLSEESDKQICDEEITEKFDNLNKKITNSQLEEKYQLQLLSDLHKIYADHSNQISNIKNASELELKVFTEGILKELSEFEESLFDENSINQSLETLSIELSDSLNPAKKQVIQKLFYRRQALLTRKKLLLNRLTKRTAENESAGFWGVSGWILSRGVNDLAIKDSIQNLKEVEAVLGSLGNRLNKELKSLFKEDKNVNRSQIETGLSEAINLTEQKKIMLEFLQTSDSTPENSFLGLEHALLLKQSEENNIAGSADIYDYLLLNQDNRALDLAVDQYNSFSESSDVLSVIDKINSGQVSGYEKSMATNVVAIFRKIPESVGSKLLGQGFEYFSIGDNYSLFLRKSEDGKYDYVTMDALEASRSDAQMTIQSIDPTVKEQIDKGKLDTEQELEFVLAHNQSVNKLGQAGLLFQTEFQDLQRLYQSGMVGRKTENFVELVREKSDKLFILVKFLNINLDKAGEALDKLKAINPALLNSKLEKDIENLEKAYRSFLFILENKELEDFLKNVHNVDFDHDTFGKWLMRDGLRMATSIATATALVIATVGSGGVGGLAIAAAVGAAGGIIGGEVYAGIYHEVTGSNQVQSRVVSILEKNKGLNLDAVKEMGETFGPEFLRNFISTFTLMGLGNLSGKALQILSAKFATETGKKLLVSKGADFVLNNLVKLKNTLTLNDDVVDIASKTYFTRLKTEIISEHLEEIIQAVSGEIGNQIDDRIGSFEFLGKKLGAGAAMAYLVSVTMCMNGKAKYKLKDHELIEGGQISLNENQVFQSFSLGNRVNVDSFIKDARNIYGEMGFNVDVDGNRLLCEQTLTIDGKVHKIEINFSFNAEENLDLENNKQSEVMMGINRDAVLDFIQSEIYTSEAFIDYLSQNEELEFLFKSDSGVGENYTIREHTLMLLELFNEHFEDRELPGNADKRLFKLALALHDIGKPDAIMDGDKSKQHIYTVSIVSDLLNRWGFSQEETGFVLSLVRADPIGKLIKAKIYGDEFRNEDFMNIVYEIEQLADEADMDRSEFFELLTVFYKCDTGSYTSHMPHISDSSLNYLFDFENPSNFNFSHTINEILDPLILEISKERLFDNGIAPQRERLDRAMERHMARLESESSITVNMSRYINDELMPWINIEITEDILEEVNGLLATGIESYYFSGTHAGALHGIKNEKSLASPWLLNEKGKITRTGEKDNMGGVSLSGTIYGGRGNDGLGTSLSYAYREETMNTVEILREEITFEKAAEISLELNELLPRIKYMTVEDCLEFLDPLNYNFIKSKDIIKLRKMVADKINEFKEFLYWAGVKSELPNEEKFPVLFGFSGKEHAYKIKTVRGREYLKTVSGEVTMGPEVSLTNAGFTDIFVQHKHIDQIIEFLEEIGMEGKVKIHSIEALMYIKKFGDDEADTSFNETMQTVHYPVSLKNRLIYKKILEVLNEN